MLKGGMRVQLINLFFIISILFLVAFSILVYINGVQEIEIYNLCSKTNWTGTFSYKDKVVVCMPDKTAQITEDFVMYETIHYK
jgi:hypothetical protein